MNEDNWIDEWLDDIEYLFQARAKQLFLLGALSMVCLATIVWNILTGDPLLKSLYWSTQTATTVGYGSGWREWEEIHFVLCIIAMFVLSTYWSCLVSVLGSYIAAWKSD